MDIFFYMSMLPSVLMYIAHHRFVLRSSSGAFEITKLVLASLAKSP